MTANLAEKPSNVFTHTSCTYFRWIEGWEGGGGKVWTGRRRCAICSASTPNAMPSFDTLKRRENQSLIIIALLHFKEVEKNFIIHLDFLE